MLCALQIENYALIRSLQITFGKGLTVITGETGAGKSILMGALSMVLGNRAETDILYDKSRKCIVEATFDISRLPLRSFFSENDLDYFDQTIIRREINEHGKSRAFINDTPVTLSLLRTLTAHLIDIHSQHQNLLLQDSAFRLDIIDQYAQNKEIKADYQEKLALLRQTERQYEHLKKQCAEAALLQEFNNFTIQEIDKAQLQVGEQESIEQTIQLLSHAEEIKSHLYYASQILSEQDENTVIRMLKNVQNECHGLQELSDEYQEIYRRLKSVIVELEDLTYEIVHKEKTVEVNPQELERLSERIDLIYTLQHKYQVDDIPALLELAQRLREEVNHYTDHQEQLAILDQQRIAHRTEALQAADSLSQSRHAVAEKFQQSVKERLQLLGMPDSSFKIEFQQKNELHLNGRDEVHFAFSANCGIAPADLSKIASGGEISRIMLALKSIITDATLLPTVIFDEIDTGISGETANQVATVMGMLSEQHQVIAISHLPQIAARGDHQYLVYKETLNGQAVTNLRLLDHEQRIAAIASILGGTRVADAAHHTAQELLNSFHSEDNQN